MIRVTIDICSPWREGTFGYRVLRQLAGWMRHVHVWAGAWAWRPLTDLDGNEIESERVSEVE